MAGATVIEHLSADPVTLVVQISRRLPPEATAAMARIALIVGPRGFMRPLTAHMQGHSNLARQYLQHAVSADLSGRRRLRMADTALGCGYPGIADELMAGVEPGTKGLAGVNARRRWYDGDMAGAVAALENGGTLERRQQRRLAGERRVFSGWQPQLPPQQGYEPQESTVLHLLTNSLPHTVSGYAQRSHSILKAQADFGWTVHAVTRIGYPVQVGRLGAAGTDIVDGIPYHRLLPGHLPFGAEARLQAQAEQMLELALQLRPAVLHTTTHFVNGLVAAAVAEALNIPWVYEVRGQLADTWASARGPEAVSSERYLQFRARETDTMQRADLVATLGTAMRDQIQAAVNGGFPVLLLPNAVGDEFLTSPLTPVEARLALGLPEASIVIGTVSSLVDYEGLDDLLRAFALLAQSHPQAYCMIVGDGTAAPALKTLAAELNIADRVVFPGRVPRSRAHLWHAALDIFVVPRKDLAVTRAVTPLKPVEASASARPVAASDLPALRELVRDDITGVFFTPGDPFSQAQILERLIRDNKLRQRLGTAGRQSVLAERTWAADAEAAIAAYLGLKGSKLT